MNLDGSAANSIANAICPACSAKAAALLVPARYLPEREPVLQCQACRTAFFEKRQPEPDYWQATGQAESYADEAVDAEYREVHESALAELARYASGKRLLDIGCGEGGFLKVAGESGWQAEGLESSEGGAKLAASRSRCRIHLGRAESFQPINMRWDVITLWDVLEHCPDPLEVISNLSKLLAPGGIMALRTPNEASAFRSISRLLTSATGGLAGGLLKYLYYHPHYITFSPAGLDALLAQAKLAPVSRRLEATPLAFAQRKIRAAYGSFPGHGLLIKALPLAYAVAAPLGRNKQVVLAKLVGV